jgi:hypothetical protein
MAMRRMIVRDSSWVIWSATVRVSSARKRQCSGSQKRTFCKASHQLVARYSGDLLPPSPPAKKATAREDQAGRAPPKRGSGFSEEQHGPFCGNCSMSVLIRPDDVLSGYLLSLIALRLKRLPFR